MDEKENTAPLHLGPPAEQFSLSPVKRDDRKARSKSLGPGGPEHTPEPQRGLRDRQQSLLNSSVRGILPDKEDAERKAARRKSMANRRVSFAPEATLHTWDVIERMGDHTTSTENSDATRATPQTSGYGSPSSQLTSDDDVDMSGMSDGSESEGDEEEESGSEEEDATGTAMSFVTDGNTTQGSVANSSTSSSLDRNLRMAAELAGTRGIEYDEYGDMSMEMVGEDTNAFQPWTEQIDEGRRGSAAFDQENMNPFPSQKLTSVREEQIGVPSTDEDMSMDVTRAVGGILTANQIQSSPFAEIPMDFTQVVGKIESPARSGRKRDHATMSDRSAAMSPLTRSKRRQSAIKSPRSPSNNSHPLLADVTGRWDETMDFTQAIGGINASSRFSEASFDGNEELSMELTTVIGGISGQYAIAASRHAAIEASSPFRVDVDPTVTRATNEHAYPVHELEAQSPTPRAKTSSTGRRSSARARRTTIEAQDVPESSPSQRRSSRRISAMSPARLGSHEDIPAAPSTPIAASTEVTPTRRLTRSATKSPRQKTKSPLPVVMEAENEGTPVQHPPAQSEATTPMRPAVEQRSMLDSIRLMTTPRKETLKAVTPKKATPSPSKKPRSAMRSAQRPPSSQPKRVPHAANDDITKLAEQNDQKTNVHLQDFLDEAGIRFMDLTTSKRRLTTATTPSRLRKMSSNLESEETSAVIALDEAVVAAACVEPELELFKHACHELKRYIDEGRTDIKALEAETYKENPLLVRAYMAANKEQRAVMDGHMRDIKTHARLRSKEMWYGWRSNLVDDLMKALATIAEDLLADDDVLQKKEDLLSTTLPPLLQRREEMQTRAEELSAVVEQTRPEEKAELQAARDQLAAADSAFEERAQLLRDLQEQIDVQNSVHDGFDKQKKECMASIAAAEKARSTSEAVSVDQVDKLKDTVKQLEREHKWSIRSASANPLIMTMAYKSQLELFFHPLVFNNGQHAAINAPIGLTHISNDGPSTTLRFFLQLLRGYLHAMSQHSTRISDMLALVATTWDIALQIVDTERLLAIEGLVDVHIEGDECLVLVSTILLPAVRTKLHVSFRILVSTEHRQCNLRTESSVKVVYGESYNEKSMSEFMKTHTESGPGTWSSAVQHLRRKLVHQGPKNVPSAS